MAAMADEEVAAFTQGRGKVETDDAAPGPAPFVAIAANDNCGTIKVIQDPRCHNADDPQVPGSVAFNNHEVFIRIKLGAEDGDDFVGDATFDRLALAVVSVEIAGEGQG